MISTKLISALIDPGSTLSYVSPNIVDKLKLKKTKHAQSWLVQLTIGTKRKVTEIVNQCSIKVVGIDTLVNVTVLPLECYDLLIGMDWIE